MKKHTSRYLAKLFLVILMLAHTQAAAVRHVGNGGGEAELKLIRMNEQINDYKSVCLIFINDCVMQSDVALIAFLNEVSSYLILNFDTNTLDISQMYINSNFLYSAETKKPLSNIELKQILLNEYFKRSKFKGSGIQLKKYFEIKKINIADLAIVQTDTDVKLISLKNKLDLSKLISDNYKIQVFEFINIDVFNKSILIRDHRTLNYYEVLFILVDDDIVDFNVRLVLLD